MQSLPPSRGTEAGLRDTEAQGRLEPLNRVPIVSQRTVAAGALLERQAIHRLCARFAEVAAVCSSEAPSASLGLVLAICARPG